jgi:adenine-specific DNA-methyltransferase
MSELELKQRIETSLSKFSSGTLLENGIQLLNTLGYRSARQVSLSPNTFTGLAEIHPPLTRMNKMKAMLDDWLSVDILFQLTGEDIQTASQDKFIFESVRRVDNQIIESYLFLAIRLKGEDYPRSKLAELTREVNKFFAMPVMILFQYGSKLTLSIINRRLNKHDDGKDVLEKVTLIKGINCAHPSRAQVEILFDLSMEQLQKKQGFKNFVELHHAWQKTLDISDLNKKFYREVADWYFYAVEHVEFPAGSIADRQTRNATSVIRLITRLIFVWFIKEKGLVPEDLFNQRRLKEILNFNDPQKSTYYKAVLQNLFFATLNTEMGAERRFRGKNTSGGRDAHFGISTVYRYEDYFKDSARALSLFASIPFLNGGLFECLDKLEDDGKVLRVDGFSDDPRNQPVVPDSLFFGNELTVDMSGIYGGKSHSKEKIRGLINIFDSYKFTIEENTPLDEEIALDPELLGKVFENLLAAYNPETGTTARKQTGSFYTPREIVNYMVDEALIAYLETALSLPVEDLSLRDASYASKQSPTDLQTPANDEQIASQSSLAITTRLRHLLAYNGEPHQFSDVEEQQLITAIDKVKVLDPACGSGAFPMGVLHKLVFILNKLDPGNVHWKERQIAKASEIPDTTVREHVIADIEQAFNENELDYGRKLYLIENCIYGVDIQPVAVQIAKLRFFISLVVDQNTNRSKPNLGIRPLPNLECKFVAANTLIGIEKPQQGVFQNPKIEWKEKQLAEVRDSLFTARTPATKRKYRDMDRQIREEIAKLLINDGWSNIIATQLSNWDPFDQNCSAAFFDSEWMFGIGNQFDVVIGNPPYGANLENSIKKHFRSAFKFVQFKIDSYALFIVIAMGLLNKNGICSYIIPNTFLNNYFLGDFRNYLLNNYVFRKIINFQGHVFEAVIHNCIIFFTNTSPDNFLQLELRLGLDNLINKIEQRHFLTTDNFAIEFKNSDESTLIQKLQSNSIRFDKVIDLRQAIKSGNDSVFISKINKSNDWKPILRGKDINRYSQHTPMLFINYGDHLACPRDHSIFEQDHILIRETGNKIIATVDTDKFYIMSSLYCGIKKVKDVDLRFILGLLNSNLFAYLMYKINFENTVGVFTKAKIYHYNQLPIRLTSEKHQNNIAKIVNEILKIKKTDPFFDTVHLEKEVDQMVYDLYELSTEEIALVEGKPSDSKRKTPSTKETAVEIIDIMTEQIEIIETPLQSDYDLYKCGLCGKLIIGHDRGNHSKEYHQGQADWNKLKNNH